MPTSKGTEEEEADADASVQERVSTLRRQDMSTGWSIITYCFILQTAEKSEALPMPMSDYFSVSQANATDATVPHGAALQPAVQRDGGV